MIFLCKDGSFCMKKSDRKALKWFQKNKSAVKAVMIESATRLHADTYLIVKAENFQMDFIPFQMKLVYCVGANDDPVDWSNTTARTFEINGPRDLYTVAVMIHQMIMCREIVEYFGMGAHVEILKMTVKVQDKVFTWTIDEKRKSAKDFLADHMMRVDTDDFLDASVPLQDRAEKGSYRAKLSRNGILRQMNDAQNDTTRIEYYYTARKAFLYICGNEWVLDVTQPKNLFVDRSSYPEDAFYTESAMEHIELFHGLIRQSDDKSTMLVGRCITGTGLVYLSSYELACMYDHVDFFQITPFFKGDVDQIYREMTRLDMKYGDPMHGDAIASDPLDMMLLALFTPQMLDVNRYLWGIEPEMINILCVVDRTTYAQADFPLPTDLLPDEGLECDIFSMIASVLIEYPKRPMPDDEWVNLH